MASRVRIQEALALGEADCAGLGFHAGVSANGVYFERELLDD